MPDGDAALEGLIAFLARFCKILNPLFDGIRKARDMERCLYEGRTFLWTFIVGHLVRLRVARWGAVGNPLNSQQVDCSPDFGPMRRENYHLRADGVCV